MNIVTITGRLIADPSDDSFENTEGITNVATLRVAVTRRDDDADYVTVVALNGLPATCNHFLNKGRVSAVEGRFRSSEWTADDKTKPSRLEIVARNVDSLDCARCWVERQRVARRCPLIWIILLYLCIHRCQWILTELVTAPPAMAGEMAKGPSPARART